MAPATTGQATLSTNEGDGGTQTINVPVALVGTGGNRDRSYTTNDGPGTHAAEGRSDYVASSGTVTFRPV